MYIPVSYPDKPYPEAHKWFSGASRWDSRYLKWCHDACRYLERFKITFHQGKLVLSKGSGVYVLKQIADTRFRAWVHYRPAEKWMGAQPGDLPIFMPLGIIDRNIKRYNSNICKLEEKLKENPTLSEISTLDGGFEVIKKYREEYLILKWQRIKASIQAYRNFLLTLEDDIRDLGAQAKITQYPFLSYRLLIEHRASHDLIEHDATLLQCIALSYYRKSRLRKQLPYRLAKSLEAKRLDIVENLNLPRRHATLRLLRKIDIARVSYPSEDVFRALSIHTNRPQKQWLYLLELDDISSSTVGLLCENAAFSKQMIKIISHLPPKDQREVEMQYHDTMHMLTEKHSTGQARAIVGRIQSPKKLNELHDELARDLREQENEKMIEMLQSTFPTPDIQLPAIDGLEIIQTGEALKQAAKTFRNCLLSYLSRILDREYVVATISCPEEHIVAGFLKIESQWHLDQYSGYKNQRPRESSIQHLKPLIDKFQNVRFMNDPLARLNGTEDDVPF